MDVYNQLIDLGYTQNEIDEMDILYHLQLLGRRKQEKDIDEKSNSQNDDGILYADEAFSGL